MSSILIIGAGMSGLTAAQKLKQHGHDVTVVDKGRGVGGRMATRRFAGGIFDHGAQFFTARLAEFEAEIRQWENANVARHWFDGYPSPTDEKPDDSYPRFCGQSGMTGICKFLMNGLTLKLGEEIKSLHYEDNHWSVAAKSGATFEAEKLLLTCPIPQSLALFDSSAQTLPSEVRQQLEAVRYEPCFAVMALLNGPSAIPDPGLFYVNGDPIWWVADNFKKGISPVEGSVTIHSSSAFAAEHYEDDQNEVGETLLRAAREFLGSPVQEFQVRRWRYSKPENPLEVGSLAVPELNLAFAGDALGGARVEGAFLSGLHAAQLLD